MHVRLKPGVEVLIDRAAIQLRSRGRVVAEFHHLQTAIIDGVRALVAGDRDATALNANVLDQAGLDGLVTWRAITDECASGNLLDFPIEYRGRWLATVDPLQAGIEPPTKNKAGAHHRRLSRFAYLRRDDGLIVLESPLARVRLHLSAVAVAAVVDGEPRVPGGGRRRYGSDDAIWALLDRYGFLESADGAEQPALATWEFHDALFHHASRLSEGTVGATYRLQGRVPPWPARKPQGSGARVALWQPDLGALVQADPPLTAVVEARRSHRNRVTPLTVEQLGEFLFRTFRVLAVDSSGSVEAMRRPIPAGGGLHELETYVAVGTCRRLDPGCYWYDAHVHALETIPADPSLTTALLDQAARSWGRRHPAPDVLITLAARVPRVAWSYERMAYRVVLMNVGVAMEAMYLAATAMGLAPCAVGNGDPRLFSTLTGLDPFEETSVGEFALSGSLAFSDREVRR